MINYGCAGDGSVAEAVMPELFRGSGFPECLGNETRLAACPTTSLLTDDITTCNPVLVNCDFQTNDGSNVHLPFDAWMVVSSIVVAIMLILILVIIIGLVSIVYSRWRASVQSAKTPTQLEVYTSNNDTHTATLAKLNSPINDTSVFTDSELHNFENPLYTETTLTNTTATDRQSRPPSDSPEHNLINPLYEDAEQPPPPSQTITTGVNTVDDRVSHDSVDLTTPEPHYETPHTPNTATSTDKCINDAIRYHRYEYIDNLVTAIPVCTPK